MRIRTQFIVAMLVFGAGLAATSASAIVTNYRVEKASEQDAIAHKIALGASELSYLANDYIFYREAQQLDRWRARFARFSVDVASLQSSEREQQALIRNIQANTRRLEGVFDSVVSTVGDTSPERGDIVTVAMLQIAWSRMAVQSQGLVSDASYLSQLLGLQVSRLQRVNSIFVIALIAVFVAYFLINFWLIQRRMLQSIAGLQAGTDVIGSGNLDFQIKEQRNDEIGDLAHAFNRMTARLQAATEEVLVERQRLYELNQTLEERVAVRTAELRDSKEELQAVFDAIVNGVVVFDASGAPVRANPAAVALLGDDPLPGSVEGPATRLPADLPPDVYQATVGRALRGERVVAEPFVYTRPDGKQLTVLASGTPLSDGDRVSGAVVVWHDITERQALEEAVRVEAKERAVLEERQRMARDLHDAVSQILFSASLTADVLPTLYARDPDHGRQLLEDLRRMNRGALAELRALLAELRPHALLETDLAVLVRQLAEAAASRSLVTISVCADQVGLLPSEVQVALYRIAQEALHNLAKHSRARQATLHLHGATGAGQAVTLSVEDDGVGFDPEALPANTFGLSIMAERAKAINATLTLHSRPGAGTRVSVEWAAS